MDTDHLFYELFRSHPEWLAYLTGIGLEPGSRGASLVLKQLERRCDLYYEPPTATGDHYIVDFQLYPDQSIFNRVELARQSLWAQLNSRNDCRRSGYQAIKVNAFIVFGSASDLPEEEAKLSNIPYTFLDEELEKLKKNDPFSPLWLALSPLTEKKKDLEANAASSYHSLRRAGEVDEFEKALLCDIFSNLLRQRFKDKGLNQIREMIAELTPLKETKSGQELLEQGIEQGIEQGELKIVLTLVNQKFPDAPPKLEQAIKELATTQLEALVVDLLSFKELGQLEAWLNNAG